MTKSLSMVLAVVLTMSCLLFGCGPQALADSDATERGSDFIADRVITIKHFFPGFALPEDQENAAVFQEIERQTGIKVRIEGMKSSDVVQEITMALAAGDLPDMVTTLLTDQMYIDIWAKGANDGMFVDAWPYVENTKRLKNVLNADYLSLEHQTTILNRESFNGALYIIPLGQGRPDVPISAWVASTGLWVREDIVKSLGVDPATIKTQDQLLDLARQIKDGDFVDGNGNKAVAIGPTIWGGSATGANGTSSNVYIPNYDFGNGTNFDLDEDGQVRHVAFTDYAMQGISFIRTLLAEGLMDKEALTMQNTQAVEAFSNAAYGMMVMHSWSQTWDTGSDMLRQNNQDKMYIPLLMNSFRGDDAKVIAQGSANTALLIPTTTQNPEECVQFVDWLIGPKTRRLMRSGIENVHYTLVPRDEDEVQDILKYTEPDPDDDMMDPIATQAYIDAQAADPNFYVNEGIRIEPLNQIASSTDTYRDAYKGFGEGDAETFRWDYGRRVQKMGAQNVKFVDGILATTLLDSFEGINNLKPLLDNYNDTFVKACFASSEEEAADIIEQYKSKLLSSGIEDACKYLQEIEDANPGTVMFYFSYN